MIVSEKELCKSNEADSSSSARLGKAIIALLVIAAVLIAALAGAWTMFGTQLTAAMTIEKLDDNLWSMEYKGDYGFDGFLEQGGAKSDAEMVVTDTPVVTNFYLHGDDGTSGSGQSYVRFNTLTQRRDAAKGVMTAEEVRTSLAAVAQSNFPGENGGEKTCWSCVYDQRELTATFYDTEDWAQPYALSLGEKDWCKKAE